MKLAALAIVLAACAAEAAPPLVIEPASIDVSVGIGETARIPVRIFAGNADVTADAVLTLDGSALGSVAPGEVIIDGSRGGTAELVARVGDRELRIPVHAKVTSTRLVNLGAEALEWFDHGREAAVDAALDPTDGAVLPPNLARLDVHFALPIEDGVHRVSITTPDLDLRIIEGTASETRTVSLTAQEWGVVARTVAGGSFELVVAGTGLGHLGSVRTQRAQLVVTDLPFPREVLFSGRAGDTEQPRIWRYSLADATTEMWAEGRAGACTGCHMAATADGKRLAVHGGGILDATSRTYIKEPDTTLRWTAAAFDPTGMLVTASQNNLVLRNGSTTEAVATLAIGVPANQPAISADGRWLAYASGPIDSYTTIAEADEIRVHAWNALTQELGPPRVMAPAVAGQKVKLPDFSADGDWLIYSQVPALFYMPGPLMAVRTDGASAPIELVPAVDFAKFATPITDASTELGRERVAWIIVKDERAVGGRDQGGRGQLWAMLFYADRGLVSQPFYLPGQRSDVAILHSPVIRP